MLMTVVEGHVAQEQWAALEEAYAAGFDHLPPGIVQTFLVHSWQDTSFWQIVTIWESREALMAMRQSVQTPAGDLIFQAAGAQPTHGVFEIVRQGKGG